MEIEMTDNSDKAQSPVVMEINNTRITWFCGLISLTGLIMGFEVGTVDHLINAPQFKLKYGNLSTALISFIMSSFNLGSLVGCLCGFTLRYIKYHHFVKMGYMVYTLGAIMNMINYSLNNVGLFISYRIITGLTSGMFLLASPIYLTKLNLDDNKRGLNLSLFQLNICCGILIGNVLNLLIDQFMVQIIINSSILLISVVSYWYLPAIIPQETRLGKLHKFFKTNTVNPNQINYYLEHFVLSKSSTNEPGQFKWKKLLYCSTLMMLQPLTGVNIFFYYSNVLFPNQTMIVIMPILNLIGSLITLKIISRFPRRSLLLGGSIILFFSYFLYDFTHHYVSIYIIILTFASTWGPISGIVMNELANLNLTILIISIMSNFFINFLLIYSSPNFIDQGNNGFTMMRIFEISMMISGSIFLEYLPETKDLSLSEIEKLF